MDLTARGTPGDPWGTPGDPWGSQYNRFCVNLGFFGDFPGLSGDLLGICIYELYDSNFSLIAILS